MTLTGKRAEFAAALSTVEGITGYPKAPSALREGDAWPLGPVLDRATGSAFVATWRVRLVAPTDEIKATDWFDQVWPSLFFAINTVAFVDRCEPVTFPDGQGNTRLGFDITARAEE